MSGAPAARTRVLAPGTRVLVTGGSSGIGLAVAGACAERGCEVLLLARPGPRLEAAATRTGGTALPADLDEPGAGARAGEAAGPVDVLVHSAGLGLAAPFTATDPERMETLTRVNATSAIALTRAVLPGMRERGRGRIVFVSSIAARLGVADETVYGATKAAVDTFAAGLRLELARSPVGVSLVVPGAVDTGFFDRRGRPYDRSIPRPQPATRVARATCRAIEHDLPDVFVPPWLRLAVGARTLAPRLYDMLATRLG